MGRNVNSSQSLGEKQWSRSFFNERSTHHHFIRQYVAGRVQYVYPSAMQLVNRWMGRSVSQSVCQSGLICGEKRSRVTSWRMKQRKTKTWDKRTIQCTYIDRLYRTWKFSQSVSHSFIHSFIHSFVCSFVRSFVHFFVHLLTYLLSQSVSEAVDQSDSLSVRVSTEFVSQVASLSIGQSVIQSVGTRMEWVSQSVAWSVSH